MRHDSTAMLDRSLDVVEQRLPELADAYMQVPLDYYSAAEHDANERALFMTSPLALLAASEIANPHDYHVRTAMGQSILLTRDGEGKAHAFLNYCRHRGAEPAKGCGNARRLSCPYHAWTYNTKGELVAMPLPDRNASLDYSKLGLVELPSEERHGFVWVVLTPGRTIDVAAYLGEVDGQLAALGIDKMKYYNSLPHEPLAANWKCIAEGVVESLHVPFVHRATFNIDPATSDGERFSSSSAIDLAIYDRFGPHVRYTLPMFSGAQADDVRSRLAAGDTELAGKVVQVWLISPGLLIAQELYGLIFGDMEPGPTTDSALFRYGWLSPYEEGPGNLPGPRAMADRAALAIQEDAPVWEGCGRGLSQGKHGYALIGRNEKGVQLFHEGLAEQTGYDGLRYVDA